MTTYHYKECGLDNVLIEGTFIRIDDDGDEVVTIPNINGLHREISRTLVEKPCGLSGKELRFLRTFMGMTQAQMAKLVHREALAISRWERDEGPMESNADAIIRMHANDVLMLKLKATTDEISGWTVPSAVAKDIRIDGTDPNNYHAIAA